MGEKGVRVGVRPHAHLFRRQRARIKAAENSLAGILNPEDGLKRRMVIFLNAASNRPHNQVFLDLTRQSLMLEGIGTDFYRASGGSSLSQQWTAI